MKKNGLRKEKGKGRIDGWMRKEVGEWMGIVRIGDVEKIRLEKRHHIGLRERDAKMTLKSLYNWVNY